MVASRGATPADQAQQVGGRCRDVDYTHPLSARQKGANQCARCENCLQCHQRLVTEKRDYWKKARFLPEKALKEEETARRMEEQKNKAIRAPPRRHRPPARAPTRTDERPDAQARSRSRIHLADVRQQREEVLKDYPHRQNYFNTCGHNRRRCHRLSSTR